MNCLKKQLLIISFALIVAIAIFLIFGSSIYINQIFFYHQCIPRYLWHSSVSLSAKL